MKVVCNPNDELFIIHNPNYPTRVCSRGRKWIFENEIMIKPNYLRYCRQGWKAYFYHAECIETNELKMYLNYLHYEYLYRLERIKRKLVFIKNVRQCTDVAKTFLRRVKTGRSEKK